MLTTPSRPNFFIVGAPRCGTTALYEYLSQHPDVFMPYYKEPMYFGSDLKKRPRTFDERQYLDLFRDHRGEKRLGEGTVWYLYSQSAPAEIKAFSPDARIIIMLREPAEMMHSLHQLMVSTGNEDLTNFRDALEAEDDRRQGRRIPRLNRRPEGLQYRACARYAPHVERYLEAFGPEAVHVILYDDLRADAAPVYRRTLEFLGLDTGFAPNFAVLNPGKGIRSEAVLRLISSPRYYRVTGRLPARLAVGIRRVVKRLNSRPRARQPLEPALRSALQREMADDVRRLERVIGRDLSHWLPAG